MIAFLSALTMMQSNFEFDFQEINKRNDTRFNNRGYSFFFLMSIFFLKHLRLVPNTLKWQGCKIFSKLVPSQTFS